MKQSSMLQSNHIRKHWNHLQINLSWSLIQMQRMRMRRITWFNPPFALNVKTNIGATFLNIIKNASLKTILYTRFATKTQSKYHVGLQLWVTQKQYQGPSGLKCILLLRQFLKLTAGLMKSWPSHSVSHLVDILFLLNASSYRVKF